jgi:chromosome segregation ATPase
MYDQLLSEKAEQFMKIDKAAREKEEIVKENEFLLSEGNAMHDDLEKHVQELEDIQDKFEIVQGEKDDLERKLAAVNIPAKASEMAKIMEERDKLKDKCHELQAENETLKHDHEIVLEEVQSMQEQCNQLQGDNEHMGQDFETAHEEFDQLTQQHEGLQQDYNQLEQDYSELLADKEKLETEFLEVQTASVKEHNSLAEEETEELKQENEMLIYEKDQLEMTIKELSKNNALLEEKLDRNKGELGKTIEKLKKEASLRVKLDTGANTDKEKQIKSLQVQVNRLQQQLAVGF